MKNRVPTSWTRPAHQASRSPDCWNCSAAAEVKKSEPTKYVTPSAVAPTQLEYGGKAPNAKQADPMMNSVAIHQPRVAPTTPLRFTDG